MLVEHLVVDRVQALFAAEHTGLDVRFLQLAANTVEDLRKEFPAIAADCAQSPRQHAETHRVDVLEGEILQMPRDVAQTQARSDGHVDLERFLGDALALLGADLRHRLQVVAAIGQFDEHDAQIARHGHQHLAEILGLRVLVGLEFEAIQLGQAVNEFGNFLAEAVGDLRFGHRRIFHHVMEKGSDDGLRIHAPFGERAGYGEGVRDIGFAGEAGLATMGLFAEAVRFEDVVNLFLRQVAQGIDEDPVGRIFELINSRAERRLRGGTVGLLRGFGVLIHGRAPNGLPLTVRPDRG